MESANLGPELQPGDVCTHGGAYEVTHRAHRGPHTVMIHKGETFPRCNGCGDAVRFRLVKEAEEIAPTRGKRARRKSAGH